MTIYDCPWCGYASKQLQKLQRHAGSCHTDQGLSAEELRTILKKVAQQSHEAAQLERETNIIRQYLRKFRAAAAAITITISRPLAERPSETCPPRSCWSVDPVRTHALLRQQQQLLSAAYYVYSGSFLRSVGRSSFNDYNNHRVEKYKSSLSISPQLLLAIDSGGYRWHFAAGAEKRCRSSLSVE